MLSQMQMQNRPFVLDEIRTFSIEIHKIYSQHLDPRSVLRLLALLLGRSATLSILASHGPTRPLPHVLPDNILHTANIVSRLAHVIKSRSPSPLRLPLHNLNTLHIRRVNLVAHLHAHARQIVAQQDGRVDFGVALLDVQAHAGEGVAGFLAHEQDVADAGAVDVLLAEEAGAGAGGVEGGDLGGGDGCYGVGAVFAGGLDLGCYGDFAHAGFEALINVRIRGFLRAR